MTNIPETENKQFGLVPVCKNFSLLRLANATTSQDKNGVYMQMAELCQFVIVLLTKTDIIVKKAIQRFNLMVFSNKIIIQIIKV